MIQHRHRIGFLTVLLSISILLVIAITTWPTYNHHALRSLVSWDESQGSMNVDNNERHLSSALSCSPQTAKVPEAGRWREEDYLAHNAYLQRVLNQVDSNPPKILTPALQELKMFIESSSRAYMYFEQMFDEIPQMPPYDEDLHGNPQIRDYDRLLEVLNHILTTTPGFHSPIPPIAAILARPLGTPSGLAAFLDPEVNSLLKQVLKEWGSYLQSPDSRLSLGRGDDDWFGQQSMLALEKAANAPYNTTDKFEDIFECDPSDEYHGFHSWDSFFTRQFRDGARPVERPDDDDILTSPCEAVVMSIKTGVKLRDKFFMKDQPYSVLDMLDHDSSAEYFAGGTVLQAFLSMLSYHRWHAPVSGTIRRAFVVDGTYYSVPLSQGIENPNITDIGVAGVGASQAYLSSVATRAVLLIEADNPNIGLMAFIAIGMEEISTCDITVLEGQHVKKGEQLGMFHFGGSSYALIFREGVVLEETPDLGNFNSPNVAVRSKLAVLRTTDTQI